MLLGPSYLEPSKRKPGGNMNTFICGKNEAYRRESHNLSLPFSQISKEIFTPYKALKGKN